MRKRRSWSRSWSDKKVHMKMQFSDVDHGKAFDWGVTATVGIEVKRWFFRLGYDISLAKEYDDGISPKYHVGTISIGYKF